ncbi:MAG: hypothetical protein EA411_13345 [Saprospirales bacterium]|nr:MAG: hypothetical protein EA411_13345 [Saprospirales bacterium]
MTLVSGSDNWIKKWGLGIFFSLFFLLAQGQECDTIDRVELMDGGVINGKILNITTDSVSVIPLSGETIWVFSKGEIKNYEIDYIKHDKPGAKNRLPFKKMGDNNTFADFGVSMLSGRNGENLYAFNLTIGYQFSRWVGLGIRTGRYRFPSYNSNNWYPISIDVRGFLLDRGLTAHYRVGLGYTFIPEKDQFIRESNGGYFFNPSIGLTWFLGNTAYISGDIGAIFSRAKFNSFGPWGSELEEIVRIRRWQGELKIGILF